MTVTIPLLMSAWLQVAGATPLSLPTPSLLEPTAPVAMRAEAGLLQGPSRLLLARNFAQPRPGTASQGTTTPTAPPTSTPTATPTTAQPSETAPAEGETPPAGEATPSGETPPASETPAAEECEIDCETCQEADRHSRYVTRRRNRLLSTHRAFALAAWGSLLVTEVLGTIQLVNQDSWFGRGECAGDPNAFGCRESAVLTGLHETFAFVTTGLYTTSGVLAIAAPDPDNASVGNGTAERTLRLHKTLAWIHGAGMVLLPLLGILSANPGIIGISGDEARVDFARAMRSLHGIIGYGTFAAYSFAAYTELF